MGDEEGGNVGRKIVVGDNGKEKRILKKGKVNNQSRNLSLKIGCLTNVPAIMFLIFIFPR